MNNPFNRSSTAFFQARAILTVVDLEVMAKVAKRAINCCEIIERRTADFNGSLEYGFDFIHKSLKAFCRFTVGANKGV